MKELDQQVHGDTLSSLKESFVQLYNREKPYVKSEIKNVAKSYLTPVTKILVGIVLLVGGFSLVLGGLTQLVTYVAIQAGMTLIPALIIGFFTIGITVMLLGVILAVSAKKGFKIPDAEKAHITASYKESQVILNKNLKLDCL